MERILEGRNTRATGVEINRLEYSSIITDLSELLYYRYSCIHISGNVVTVIFVGFVIFKRNGLEISRPRKGGWIGKELFINCFRFVPAPSLLVGRRELKVPVMMVHGLLVAEAQDEQTGQYDAEKA